MKMNMKKLSFYLSLSLILSMLVFGLGCPQNTEHKPNSDKQNNIANDTYTIGAILPLTGRFAFMGLPIKNAMDLALDEVNSNLSLNQKKIDIIYSDSQGDAKMGVTAAQKLIDVDKVDAITTFLTGVSLAVKPVTEERGVLLIAQTVSPFITKDSKFTIRMHYSFEKEGEVLADYIKSNVDGPVGFIRSNDSSTGYEVTEVIIPALSKNGVESIYDETFNIGNKDFKSHVSKMKLEGVTQISLLAYGSDMPNILKEIYSNELLNTTTISGNLGFVELPQEVTSDLLKGIVFTCPPYLISSMKSENIKSFEGNYREKYNVNTISYSAYYAYDVIFLLEQASALANSTKSSEIMNAVSSNTFELMTGFYDFDEFGEAHPPITLASFNEKMEIFPVDMGNKN